jgi:hypothetical protein
MYAYHAVRLHSVVSLLMGKLASVCFRLNFFEPSRARYGASREYTIPILEDQVRQQSKVDDNPTTYVGTWDTCAKLKGCGIGS